MSFSLYFYRKTQEIYELNFGIVTLIGTYFKLTVNIASVQGKKGCIVARGSQPTVEMAACSECHCALSFAVGGSVSVGGGGVCVLSSFIVCLLPSSSQAVLQPLHPHWALCSCAALQTLKAASFLTTFFLFV